MLIGEGCQKKERKKKGGGGEREKRTGDCAPNLYIISL